MRAVLKAFNENRRHIWVVDSSKELGHNGLATHGKVGRVSPVRSVDNQVRFIPGDFTDMAQWASLERISLLHLSAGEYHPAMDILENLYWKITNPIVPIDGTRIYWRHRK
jgi:hypothetical protein